MPDYLASLFNFQQYMLLVAKAKGHPAYTGVSSLLYNEHYYLSHNPDVAAAVQRRQVLSGYDHFVNTGLAEGRAPNSFYDIFFDEDLYFLANPDVKAAVQAGVFGSGLHHYILYGLNEGRDALALTFQIGGVQIAKFFDETYYLASNPDVAAAVASGLLAYGYEHFLQAGIYEGRSPNQYYNEADYLARHTDVRDAIAAGFFKSGIQHYLMYGYAENRSLNPPENDERVDGSSSPPMFSGDPTPSPEDNSLDPVDDTAGGEVTVNAAPIAQTDSYQTGADVPLAIAADTGVLSNDSDPDADAITVSTYDVTSENGGTVVMNADGSFTYTPAAGFSGGDRFTYVVSDSNGATDVAEVNITVEPAAPFEGVAIRIEAENYVDFFDTTAGNNFRKYRNDDVDIEETTDLDGGFNVAQVAAGEWLTYDLEVAAAGTYEVRARVASNRPGLFNLQASVGDQNATVNFSGTGGWQNWETITLGNLLLAAGSQSLRLDLLSDKFNLNYLELVPISGNAPDNAPPVATADVYTAIEDTSLVVPAVSGVLDNDTDADADPLTISAYDVTSVNGGTVAMNPDGSFTYTPADNFNGSDSFTYTVSDGNGTDTATVNLTVGAANDTPATTNDALTASENQALVFTANDLVVNDTDIDGDSLTVTAVSNAVNGTVILNEGEITFTPEPDFTGDASFDYTIQDPLGATATGTVTVTVNAAASNTPPDAIADQYTTDEDTTLTVIADAGVLSNDTDADTDPLTVTAYDTTSANGGTVTMNADGSFTYTPATNFSGDDSFTYTISDGDGDTDTTTVALTVNPVNDTPTGVTIRIEAEDYTDFFDTTAGNNFNQYRNDDVDIQSTSDTGGGYNIGQVEAGEWLTYALNVTATGTYEVQARVASNRSGPFGLEASVGNQSVTATFSGTGGWQSWETVTLGNIALAAGSQPLRLDLLAAKFNLNYLELVQVSNEGPANTAPTAQADDYLAVEDTALVVSFEAGVLSNDNDLDADPLSVTAYDTTSANGGTVSVNSDGSFTYLAAADFIGSDSFTYTVEDGEGGTDTETVTLTVTPDYSDAGADTLNYAQSNQAVLVKLAENTVSWLSYGANFHLMPLGDSVTEGWDASKIAKANPSYKTTHEGYRLDLWEDLQALQLPVDFVGSRAHGPSPLGDKDHEGHPGETLDWVRQRVDGYIRDARPEVILLMLGTNDGDAPGSTLAGRLSNLIDEILDTPEFTGHVLVGTVAPAHPDGEYYDRRSTNLSNYNSLIPGVVSSKNTDRVRFVEVGSRLDERADMADPSVDNGLHPNQQGYVEMAAAWYTALLDVVIDQTATLGSEVNVIGSVFDDVLIGDGNANVIEGGLGEDVLTGGGGSDRFIYRTRSEGVDTLTDFGHDDLIQIVAANFDGALNAGFSLDQAGSGGTWVSGASPVASSGAGTFLYNTNTGKLSYDADGSGIGAAVDFLQLSNVPALTANQIEFI